LHTAVYLHIPFCRTKCSYCDFNTYAGIEPLIPRYLEALAAEMGRYPAGLPVQTINFGGGTPSLLSPEQLGGLIGAARRHFAVDNQAEVSIEANPGGLGQAYFEGLLEAGVNRLSFGVQSFHAQELTMLARRHSGAEASDAIAAARAAGFSNVNLDFMYGLPGQRIENWRGNLEDALELRPEHLSLYGLTVYDHLPLGRRVRAGELPVQDEDLPATSSTRSRTGRSPRSYAAATTWPIGETPATSGLAPAPIPISKASATPTSRTRALTARKLRLARC
jgi:oxygen-independent coproporphyrinogen III oxidase